MKKRILLMSTFCLALFGGASGQTLQDSVAEAPAEVKEVMLQELKPTYLKNISEAANWGRNWFIELKGGASAFLGSPLGCGDVFDRITPALQVGIGKWFTPAVGGRLAFQGMTFKNAEFQSMKYQFVHADFMYNLTAFIRQNDQGLSRWDVIPYVGVGMVHNSDWTSPSVGSSRTSGSHPFAFSYGIETRYRLTDRMHLIAELAGMTTAKNFDCIGLSSRFGDNMVSLSAGLSFSLGKVGYRRVVDANPYIVQNEWLIDYANRLQVRNRALSSQHKEDERIKAEYRKILEIEGLLDLYRDKIPDDKKTGVRPLYPRNDYSGLNSLRARMNNRGWDGRPETKPRALQKRDEGVSDDEAGESFNGSDMWSDAYITAMMRGEKPVGAPIFFFFNIGTDELTDMSQKLNLDEIARVVRESPVNVKVVGAADAATGNEQINNSLSMRRADYVKRLLMERGIESSRINVVYEGGINDFSPVQANRNTCVILSF